MTIRPELFSLTVEEARRYVAFAKQRGGPEARAEAIELEAFYEKTAAGEIERFLKRQPAAPGGDPSGARLASTEEGGADGSLTLDSAESFVKSGTEPLFGPRRYEDAVLAQADRQRREGESVEKCLARLIQEKDPAVNALWAAANRSRALLAKRADDLAREGAADRLSKKADLEAQLDAYVRANQRPEDGTFEKAYDRLLRTDRTAIDMAVRLTDLGS